MFRQKFPPMHDDKNAHKLKDKIAKSAASPLSTFCQLWQFSGCLQG